MSIRQFLKLVEIQTKVASLLPFLVGIVFTLYRYSTFNLIPILPLFISLLCIDLATTALNNLMDYERDHIKEGYHYDVHNAIGHYGLSTNKVKFIIIILLVIGSGFGIFVALMTDVVVLLLGMIAFGVGILYSFGPLPISRTPLGELFSGLFMGFLIFFVVVYSQIFELGFINIAVDKDILLIQINFIEMILLFFVSLPLVMGIANIMLANNISDVNEDVVNRRYTLPYYIGKKNSLIVYDLLTYVPWIIVTVCVIVRVLPVTALMVWLVLLPIRKNVQQFHVVQSKEKTFIYVVKNFMLFSGVYAVSILIGDIIRFILN